MTKVLRKARTAKIAKQNNHAVILQAAPSAGRKGIRFSLLVATALGSVLGIGSMAPQPAFAACVLVAGPPTDVITCSGVTAGPVGPFASTFDLTATFNPGATIISPAAGITLSASDTGGGQNPVITFNFQNATNAINAGAGDGINLALKGDNGVVNATGFAGSVTAAGGNAITINNTGFNVAAVTVSTTATSHLNTDKDGINVNIAGGGSINVTSAGIIDANQSALNLSMGGAGTIVASNSAGGKLNSFGIASTVNLNSNSGNAAFTNSGSINNSSTGNGVTITTGSGNASYTSNAGSTVDTGGNGVALTTASGSITVLNNGKIGLGQTPAEPVGGVGILATQNGPGSVDITSGGAIAAAGNGIQANGKGGAVNITTTAGGTIATNSSGIVATSGSGPVTIVTADTITSNSKAAQSGISVVSNTGNIAITSGGAISVNAVTGTGITATTGGNGTNSVTLNAAIIQSNNGIVNNGGSTGPVTTIVNANITAANNGVNASNLGSSKAGDVNVVINKNATITAGGIGVTAASVVGNVFVLGDGGSGLITGGTFGVLAASGSGDVNVSVKDVTATQLGATAISVASLTGSVIVNANNVTANDPATSLGVNAVTGKGNVTVNIVGTTTAGLTGINAVTAGPGAVAVTANAINYTGGKGTGFGVNAVSAGGNVVVNANGNITGNGLADINALTTGNGSNTVNINGVLDVATFGSVQTADKGAIITNVNKNVTALDTGIVDANNGAAGTGDITIAIANKSNIIGGKIGILAVSGAGDIHITGGANAGLIQGANFGVNVVAGTGNIDIAVNNVTADNATNGVAVSALTGKGSVTVSTVGQVTGGNTGVSAITTGTGAVTVTTNGVNVTGNTKTGSGVIAITAGGDVKVTTNGEVTGNGQFGIFALTNDGTKTGGQGTNTVTINAVIDPPLVGSAQFAGLGAINTNVNANVTGTIGGIYDANVGSGAVGSINVNLAAGVNVNGGAIYGIRTESVAGDVNIKGATSGTISGGLFGIDVNAGIGNTNINVNNVTATDPLGFAIDVHDGAGLGNFAGPLGVGALNAILVPTGGNVAIETHGTVSGGSAGIRVIKALPGDIAVTTDGATSANGGILGLGGNAIDIIRLLGNGNTKVTTQTGSTLTATGDAISIVSLLGTGNIDVVANGGAINAGHDGIFINKLIGDGNVTVTTAATATIGSKANPVGDDGIQIINPGTTGDTTVTTNAVIWANDEGIQVIRNGGAQGVNGITVTANAAVFGGRDAIQVQAGGGYLGNITVTANKGLTATDDGVQILANGQVGNVSVNTVGGTVQAVDQGIQIVRNGAGAQGNITVTTDAVNSTGHDAIQIVANGNAGNFLVSVTTNGALTAADDGVQIFHNGSTGNVVVNNKASITATDQGIDIRQNGGSTGSVTVTADADISSKTHDAIQISANGSAAPVTVNVSTGVNLAAADDGIQIFQNGSSGAVNVTNKGNIGTLAAPIGDIGVQVTANNGVDRVITVTNATTGTIIAKDSAIDVQAVGTGTHQVKVDNSGVLDGLGATAASATVRVVADGTITINNNATGVIRAGDPLANLAAVFTNDGATAVTNLTNAGQLYGRVSLNTATPNRGNTFINSGNWFTSGGLDPANPQINRVGLTGNDQLTNTGLIVTGGPSVANDFLATCPATPVGAGAVNCANGVMANNGFGAGITTIDFDAGNNNVVNMGTILVNGTTTFANTGNLGFNNAGGLINMLNGVATRGGNFGSVANTGFGVFGALGTAGTSVGDVTVIQGNFTGGSIPGASRLWSDAFLKGPNATSASDILVVGGSVQGVTSIRVNDLNAGPGAYNPSGIPLVYVPLGSAPANAFVLDPTSSHFSQAFGGTIDKGLFFYHLDLVQANPFDPLCAAGGLPPGAIFCQAYVLKSDANATARQLASAITGAQNIWYESALLWEDRQTEVRNRYRSGFYAGGADMAVKARPAAVEQDIPNNAVWAKVLGSWTNRDNVQALVAGNVNFNTDLGYKQNTFGIIGGITGGVDQMFSRFDAVSLSLMGGYLDSTVKFNTAGTQFNYTGATGGVSASYMWGGFFVDAMVKADVLNLKFNTPQLGGNVLADANAVTVGGIGNLGYRLDIGRFFMEPIFTVAYARTSIDNIAALNALGADIRWGDGDSLRVAGGSRFGVSMMPIGGNHRVEASMTLRYWDELLGNNNSVILAGPVDAVLGDNFKKGFGEVKGGIDVISIASGWSGFANAGLKFNDEQTTVTAKGGLAYKWDWR